MKNLRGWIVACFICCLLAEHALSKNPNVLFIAVDDMRCELGCYGAGHVKTPNIDQLARSGVLFRRAYCQQAVCNPSRVSLMTGLRPDTTRVWDLTTEMRTVLPNALTIPQHFRQNGYRAVAYGKICHNPFPDAASWDEPTHNAQNVIAFSEANRKRLAEFKRERKEAGEPEARVERMRGPATEIQDEPDERNFDGKQTSDAIAKMRELAAGSQPFFLAVGYIRPHLPFITPRPYWEMYNREEIPLAANGFIPRNSPDVAFGDRSMGGFYELRGYMDYADAPSPFDRPLSESQQRELKHGYYASVSFVDAQIGRLTGELERLGLADNTIVVLWSDHGWKLGEHGGWCKQTNYEIDTRTPLIIRAPKAKDNGKSSDSLVEFVDIYPTLCELAGISTPAGLAGTSLTPILQDATQQVKQAAFSQFPRLHAGKNYMGYAMRTDRYRYIEWLDAVNGEVVARELYDHAVDPDENENRALAPESRDTLLALEKQMWSTLPKPTFPLETVRSESTNNTATTTPNRNASEQIAALEWIPKSDPQVDFPPSKPSGAMQPVTFTNQRSEKVELVWQGPDGSQKVYKILAMNESFRIRTRPGIVWKVRLEQGDWLGHFQVEAHANGASAVIPAGAPVNPAPDQSAQSEYPNRKRYSVSGWSVYVHNELLSDSSKRLTDKALDLLKVQLNEIKRVVPKPAVEKLQTVPLFFTAEYPNTRPGAEYHPDKGWLKEHSRDPKMAKGVEFTNIRIFEQETGRMPNFALHELSHAYHDLFLQDGFRNQDIQMAYDRVKASGKYDRVERWNGIGQPTSQEKAYAMVTPMEYFAESSEAYFCKNDFFPFERKQLKLHDPEMLSLLERLWGVKP